MKINNVVAASIVFILSLTMIPSSMDINAQSGIDDRNFISYNALFPLEYYFNEGSGLNTYEDSDRNSIMSGTLNNNPTWTNGRDFNNNALGFSPSASQYVNIQSSTSVDIQDENQWAIYANIKSPSVQTYQDEKLPIISKVGIVYGQFGGISQIKGFSFYINEMGHLCFDAYDFNIAGSQNSIHIEAHGIQLKDDDWHFVAVSYSANIYALYIDPTIDSMGLVATFSSNIEPGPNTNPIEIGRGWAHDLTLFPTFPTLSTWYFRGEIDDVHIISVEEGLPWGLKNQGYWTFDEGSRTSDQIDYINDRCNWEFEDRGTLNGATFTSNSKVGPNALQCINYGETNNQFATIGDNENSLDLNDNGMYIDVWFKLNNEDQDLHTILYKKDLNPDNGYHLYTWISADPPEYTTLRGCIVFKYWNNGEYHSISPAGQNIQMNEWFRVIIKQDGDFTRFLLFDDSNQVVMDRNLYSRFLPGETVSDLYIGIMNPSHDDLGLSSGLNGIIDDLKLGGYRPRNIHIPFDTNYQPLSGEGVFTSQIGNPKHTGNTPYGKAYEFNGNGDGFCVIPYPFMEYDAETYHFEAQVFPFDREMYKEYDGNNLDDEIIIAQFQNWVLYIDEDKILNLDICSWDEMNFIKDTICTSSEIEFFKWSRVNISVRNCYYELYLDNKLVGRDCIEHETSFGTLKIGYGSLMGESGWESGYKSFFGYIDEVRYCSNTPEYNDWNIVPLDYTPQLSLDFDEGAGYLTHDNSGFNNNAMLGIGMSGRATNDDTNQNSNYRIYKMDDTGFPSWVDNTCEVTTVGGTNKGISKPIVGVDTYGDDVDYISVGSSNPYSENIDQSTTFYIQKNNPIWNENGVYGRCLSFENPFSTSYVKIDGSESLNAVDHLTIRFWMKTQFTSSFILGRWETKPDGSEDQNGQFFIEIENGKIKFSLCKEEIEIDEYTYETTIIGEEVSLLSQQSLNTNQWYHIQCSVIEGKGLIFINGNLDKEVDLGINSIFNQEYEDDAIYIGNKLFDPPSITGFNGEIDQLELYTNKIDFGVIDKHYDFSSGGITIDDSSVFNHDAKNYGATISSGKFGSGLYMDGNDYVRMICNGFTTYSVDTWVKVDQGTHCVSVYSVSNNNPTHQFPAIFRIEGNGQLSLETSPGKKVFSSNSIEWGLWNHISYSVMSSYDNIDIHEDNSVNFYINGLADSTYKNVEFTTQSQIPNLIDSYSYIGRNPGNVWGQSLPEEYFTGLIDEYKIKNGPRSYREDIDGDDMPDGYEILRSVNSDQYSSVEHNYRVAVLFAPHFNNYERQYVYDITNMRINLRSLGIEDNDILFMSQKKEGELVPDWLSAPYIDGEPRKDILGYVMDALEFGGPADIYSGEGGSRIEQFHSVPKLSDRDMLFIDLRDHGVGYYDSPAPNSDTSDFNYDKYYGWRGGNCSSVESDGTGAEEEGIGVGEYLEENFVFEPHYFGTTSQNKDDNDPDFFHGEQFYEGANAKTRYTIDLDGDEYLEELYLVRDYDETIPGFSYGPDYTKPVSGHKLWIRLYMDGYDFDENINSVDTDGDGRDTIWDGQVEAYTNPADGGSSNFYDPLRIIGIDMNQDDIMNYFDNTDFTEEYNDELEDYIDVDEGIVCLFPLNGMEIHEVENDIDDSTGTLAASQFPFHAIWFDDKIKDEIQDISFKDVSIVIDACYSGGFANEFSSISSTFFSSNREEDTSYRYNSMFYSRLRGEITATFYRFDSGSEANMRIQYLDELRTNSLDPDRYMTVNADGARGQKSIAGEPVGNVHNGDRDLLWDNTNDFTGVLGLYNDIISINEAMIYTDAILADHYDDGGFGHNARVPLNKAYWKHNPVLLFADGQERQIYI